MTKIFQTRLPQRRSFLSAALALIALAVMPATALSAVRDPGAEAFVQTNAQKVVSVLANKQLSDEQKAAAFHKAIDELADVPRVTHFVLGKYSRTVTPQQRARFTRAFRDYAESVYQNRLDDYRGESVRVTGSTVRKPGDVIVNTSISGGQLKQPVLVSWRVLGSGQNWKVVDVQFKGVWLAITQQQDFVSTIDNAGGNVDVLTAQLEREAKQPSKR